MARSDFKEKELLSELENKINQELQSDRTNLSNLVGQWNQIISNIYGQLAIAQYGEEALVDPVTGNLISRQLLFEGFGVSSGNVNGWLKRFNGATMSNSTAMMFASPVFVCFAEFTCSNIEVGRTIQLRHYAPDGSDGQIVGEFPVNLQDSQLGYLNNARILIPAGRRFAPWMQGDTFRLPQLRVSYRKILQSVN